MALQDYSEPQLLDLDLESNVRWRLRFLSNLRTRKSLLNLILLLMANTLIRLLLPSPTCMQAGVISTQYIFIWWVKWGWIKDQSAFKTGLPKHYSFWFLFLLLKSARLRNWLPLLESVYTESYQFLEPKTRGSWFLLASPAILGPSVAEALTVPEVEGASVFLPFPKAKLYE